MIYIQINGRALDIPEGAKLSFERHNNMISTTLRAARSSELELPATRTNCDVFGIQSVLQLDPLSERAKGANKQSAFVAVDGYRLNGAVVYLVEVTKKQTLKVCVVYDELFSLLAKYKEMKLKDVYKNAMNIYTEGGGTSATASVPSVFSVPLYLNGSGDLLSPYLFPSVNLYHLLTDVDTIHGERFTIDLPLGGSELQRVGVLPEKIEPPKDRAVTLAVDAQGEITAYSGYFFKVVASSRNYETIDDGAQVFNEYNIECFAIADDVDSVEIVFPYDFPDDVFLIQITPFAEATQPSMAGQIFHGDWSFETMFFSVENPTRQEYGVPLKGRKVKIERVTEIDENTQRVNYFQFVKKSTFRNEGWYDNNVVYHARFGYSTFNAFSCSVTATSGNSGLRMLAQGQRIYLPYNLPDWTIAQTLQVLCELGNFYAVAEGGHIVLGRRGSYALARFVLDKVLDCKSIKRRFGDYAQRNIVRFDSEKNIGDDEKMQQIYECASDVLDDSKDLYVIGASEGTSRIDSRVVAAGIDFDFLFRQDVVSSYELDDEGEVSLKTEMVAEKPCIHSRSADTPMWACRVSLERNTMLAQLCENLQEVEVSALCDFWKFQQLKDNTLVLFEGVEWLWSKAVWGEQKITLTLHRL